MLVDLLHRPTSPSTDSGLDLPQAWRASLAAAGACVRPDFTGGSAFTGGALSRPGAGRDAVAAAAADFATLWSSGPAPEIIHTFGVTATAAALRADPPAPVIATFHESAEIGQREIELASAVHAVVSLSSEEHHGWERRGVTSLLAGPLPLAIAIPDRNACADPAGGVVTMSAGRDLDELLFSMRYWSGPLTVLAALTPRRRAQVQRTIAELGLRSRVELCPDPDAGARTRAWDGAAAVYVGVEGSQHALPVLEAAAHGVPALARNLGANRDLVLSGTTGLLIDAPGRLPTEDGTPGRALAAMLADPFQLRALGTAALVRVGTANAASTSSAQLRDLYRRALAGAAVPQPPRQACPERDALVMAHLPLARQLAGWYTGRGQSADDLFQVACVGLVQAAIRFDPCHGREFHSFAIPTILGEIRKHFRDNAWAVRVPRGLQESTLLVQRAAETLSQTYGQPPTVAQLAAHLELDEQDVRLALQTEGEARYAHSLDAPLGAHAADSLAGAEESALDTIELRHDVREAIAALPEREQRILLMRFYGERTQSEISDVLGISQVHVSRVLARTLASLRDHVMYDLPLPQSVPQEAMAS